MFGFKYHYRNKQSNTNKYYCYQKNGFDVLRLCHSKIHNFASKLESSARDIRKCLHLINLSKLRLRQYQNTMKYSDSLQYGLTQEDAGILYKNVSLCVAFSSLEAILCDV